MLEKNGKLYAFVNSHSPEEFKVELKDNEIEVREVPFLNNTKLNGSIHCATNQIPIDFKYRIPNLER